ncbi:MAG TPA: glycerophosphodiester phosphodiesterase [Paenalcaligenes sp.]|nr:glycerophosphodiester phosphodiesterase [Paenalcaligenes sp.]
MTLSKRVWPYPRMIAHRGAGLNAPENTLSAMRYGAAHGYQMFEYDVKLSRDDVPVLVHDDTLDRTSNATGVVNEYSLAQLSHYDFGAWHSNEYIGEPVLTLNGMANFSIPKGLHSNIEIKPNKGLEKHTGQIVAKQAQQLWQRASLPPVLSSFSIAALEAAASSAPELPRALLIEQHQEVPVLIRQMHHLQCIGLNIDYRLLSPELLSACGAEGLFVCVWTVNEVERIRALFAQGVDAVITDEVHCAPADLSSGTLL